MQRQPGLTASIILVVDDQKTHQTKIALAVRELGHEVSIVSTAAEA